MKPLLTSSARALCAIACLTGLASPAFADLSGDYGTDHWVTANTAGGNGTVTASADHVVLTSSDFSLVDATPVESWLSHAITVARDTQFSFDWRYQTDDMSSSYDVFGYTLNGAFTQLSQDGLSFLDIQSGHLSVHVAAGTTFAWSLRSMDSEGGAAVVNLSALSAIPAVPEPASISLLMAGLGVLGWAGRKRVR